MRQYIRHPARIPIDYVVDAEGVRDREPLADIGRGGLCFLSREALPAGACLHISIPVGEPAFEAEGVVRWCRAAGGRYEVGVAFGEGDEAYRLRMVEQVCHIEAYRERVRTEEGRVLTCEEAASEWIGKNAAAFPD
ncbi:MAG: PilZ domain-containing protein [Gammaproteobacteria bacterium]|nr:PilZ domain-containing protein [Gammaproteobacteria bacterium]